MSTPYIEIPSVDKLLSVSHEDQERSNLVTITASGVIDTDPGGYTIDKATNDIGAMNTSISTAR